MILFTQIINFTLQVLIVLLIVQFIRRKEEIVAALIRKAERIEKMAFEEDYHPAYCGRR